ncbi:substrate-binding domain-containing protein [Flavobacterium sp. SUN052]|uniref:PstS family phosphate ABC transporter substrate-binding protein n=1 Tax=Flavobacterium sp. SUN052 TaxID=3002441 RepID=UPI00237E5BB6|nr:substrate-binding domain-containing protein [Flavobacterium sp. SUN052]MEC4004713.1 substrate-binding domain-containing protein [Flavobacterium sp. SUN052]
MNKYIKNSIFLILGLILLVFSCNKKQNNSSNETTVSETKANVLVDETLLPIIEDQLTVFENSSTAKITLIPESEKESIVSLFDNKAAIIVLSRKLNEQETNILAQKKIVPRTTKIATDAVAFIKSKTSNDTLVALKDVIDFVKGKQNGIKGLVFDNPNSSTVRYICELAGVNNLPEKGIFSFKTNDEVIKYVSKNEDLIGVVGINWMIQPKLEMQQYINSVNIMSVKGTDNEFIYPSQDEIGMKKYPLARDLYIIDCQGYHGLGNKFASFVAGQRGQRIILKSGLLPVRMPGRNLITRKQI